MAAPLAIARLLPAGLLALLALSLALAAAEPEAVLGGYRLAMPPEFRRVPGLFPDPMRTDVLRTGLGPALRAAGIAPDDPRLVVILPPGAAAADVRGRAFLVRIRATLKDAGLSPLLRFERDCAAFFGRRTTLRAFDDGALIGHCAEIAEVPRYIICHYGAADAICGGGLDSVGLYRLADDPAHLAARAAWLRAPGEDSGRRLLDSLREAAMVPEVIDLILRIERDP